MVTNPSQLISDLYSTDKEKNNKENTIILSDEKEEANKENIKVLDTKRKNKHGHKSKEEKSLMLDIPTEYIEIYEILREAMPRDEIAIRVNKDIKEVNTLLTMMEIEGYIEQVEGGNFKRKHAQ